jgi:hypothetical protein
VTVLAHLDYGLASNFLRGFTDSQLTAHFFEYEMGAQFSAYVLTFFRSLQNNKISGDIPPEIGKLTNLNALDLSSNDFVGDIPNSLGQLTKLNYL